MANLVVKSFINYVCYSEDAVAKALRLSQNQSDRALFKLAEYVTMSPDGRAAQFLEHFLSGSGKTIKFDCKTLLKEDSGVRQRVTSEIIKRIKANPSLLTAKYCGGDLCMPIRQSDFSVLDWKYALGSFPIEWSVIATKKPYSRGPMCVFNLGVNYIDLGTLALTKSKSPGLYSEEVATAVYIYGENEYKWHPTDDRISQCVHKAGERLTKSKTTPAKNFMMVGKGCILPLSY